MIDTRAALTRDDFEVPPASGPDAGVLAGTARWSNGPEHAARRAEALALLGRVDAPVAAEAAALATRTALLALPYERVDVLPIVRTIPLTVLATLLAGCAGPAVTGVLLQSRDATAALVAARLAGRSEAPVVWTKRVAGSDTEVDGQRCPGGTTVTVPLEEHRFGLGAHECPGQAVAVAMAEAIAGAVLERWRPVAGPPTYDPALPNLRLPLEVLVERR